MKIKCKEPGCLEYVYYDGTWSVKLVGYGTENFLKLDSVIDLQSISTVTNNDLPDMKDVTIELNQDIKNSLKNDERVLRLKLKEIFPNTFHNISFNDKSIDLSTSSVLATVTENKDFFKEITLKIENKPNNIEIALECPNGHTNLYYVSVDNS